MRTLNFQQSFTNFFKKIFCEKICQIEIECRNSGLN